MIKIWQSYSCNNSTSYRIVARFAEPLVAAETAAELAAFIAEHRREVEANKNRFDESYAALVLADKYGLDPDELVIQGNGMIGEIEVAAEGDILAVYLDYSLGFGDAFRKYVELRGAATVNVNAHRRIELSVLFDHARDDAALLAELDAMIAQNDRDPKQRFVTPWSPHGHSGRSQVFRDAGTVGLYLDITPDDLPSIRAWLAGHGIEASLRLCQPEDFATFRVVGAARCTACEGPLQYLDPRLHDIEHPQLVCKPCGGLYDLTTFEIASESEPS